MDHLETLDQVLRLVCVCLCVCVGPSGAHHADPRPQKRVFLYSRKQSVSSVKKRMMEIPNPRDGARVRTRMRATDTLTPAHGRYEFGGISGLGPSQHLASAPFSILLQHRFSTASAPLHVALLRGPFKWPFYVALLRGPFTWPLQHRLQHPRAHQPIASPRLASGRARRAGSG